MQTEFLLATINNDSNKPSFFELLIMEQMYVRLLFVCVCWYSNLIFFICSLGIK